MVKRISIKYIAVIVVVLFFLSCKKENNINQKNGETIDFYGQLIFPDTIFVDEYYKSYIDYSYPEFDKYYKNKNHKILRSLTFYFTIDTIRYDSGKIENKIEDSIWSSNKNKIELYKIAIGKPGIHYISGYIDDKILIDSLNRNTKIGELPGFSFRSYLTKEIVVLEKNH